MEEKKHIGQLFDRIAGTYDGLNHLLSANIDRRWRRITVRKMVGGEHILDVAIGTADLTIEMLRRQKAKQVTGIDLSQKMMEIGKRKVERAKEVETDMVTFVYGNAQAMPFEEASFDGVTCAFGCRNFQKLDEGLREMCRVLKPGKQVVMLEFSYPTNKLIGGLYDFYFSHVLPLMGRILSRDKTAYTYLNKSVKGFVWGEDFLQHLRAAGFKEGQFMPLTFGIATIYTAIK